MNELSWLLYFAGIAGPLSHALSLLAGIALVLLGGSAFILGVTYGMSGKERYDDADAIANKKALRAACVKHGKALPKWLFVPVLCILLAGLIPPKNTLYLIAASEVGEEVVTSPTMAKAIEALNRILDNVAKPAK